MISITLDIFYEVAEFIDHPPTISSLTLLCKDLHPVFRRRLMRDVHLSRSCRAKSFLELISSSPQHLSYVKRLYLILHEDQPRQLTYASPPSINETVSSIVFGGARTQVGLLSDGIQFQSLTYLRISGLDIGSVQSFKSFLQGAPSLRAITAIYSCTFLFHFLLQPLLSLHQTKIQYLSCPHL